MRRLTCFIVLLALCAGLSVGCKESSPYAPIEPGSSSGEFYLLMDELFVDWVSSDGLSLNFFLADPGRFGVVDPDLTFGEVTSPETILESIQINQELSDRLGGFRYEELDPGQQVVYDILTRNLQLLDIMNSEEDYPYLLGYIRPLNGVQVQLPILLAEYNFRSVEDFELYFQLLSDIGRYFEEILDFERERVRRGFFLSDVNTEKVIEHCESFLADREDNLLIVIFNDMVSQLEGISSEQREQFMERNMDLVLGNVLPAYELLLGELQEFKGRGSNDGGLSGLPGGEKFAAAYLKYLTGSDKSPAEVDVLLEEWMQMSMQNAARAVLEDSRLLEVISDGTLGQIVSDSPEVFLIRLQKAMLHDFPQMEEIRYVVREVHERLQEHVSPAFFLTPAIDEFDDNTIYLNPSSISDDLSLFTILAHEGYPGHMYQIVYNLQQSPHPVRRALGNTGYSEGWATYAEMESYYYAGLHEAEASLLRYSKIYDLLFLSRIDLGVNALGWGIEQVTSLCEDLGFYDPEFISEIFEMVIGNPLFYLPYSLGFIELSLLREEAEERLHADFELIEFHRFVLDFGPAPFSLLREHMQTWIADEKERARSRAA